MNIVTADGGFDFSVDFNNQEQLAFRLLLTQVFYAITMQKYNGNFKFVIKNMSFIEPIAKKIKFFIIKKKYFYTQYGYFVPSRFFNNITTLKFKNLNIRVPKNYLDYLKCVYGKSWKIPIKKKNKRL